MDDVRLITKKKKKEKELETLIEKIRIYSCNIMAEGFRFMPLGLVGLRTFQLSA